jgi:hypothetical protein
MAYRVAGAVLVLAAVAADLVGAHALAFDVLLAAVPACAIAALGSVAALLERPGEVATLQAILWGLCLAFVVVGSAARSPLVEAGDVPPLAVSTLRAALVVLAVKASLWAWSVARPRLVRGPAPRATRA